MASKLDNSIHPEIVGLGAINADRLYRVQRLTIDGETTVIESKFSPGGSAANTIHGLAKLGVRAGFIGAIGEDTEGKRLINALHQIGVDTGRIRFKEGAQTGVALCLSDPSGKRAIYVLPGANNLLTLKDVDIDYVKNAAFLHTSSFASEKQFNLQIELTARIKPSVKVSFAPGELYAAKGLKGLSPLLEKTYVLFLNHNEMKQIAGEDISAGAGMCLNLGCKIVAVTLGKGARYQGVMASSYIRDANGEYLVKAADPITGSVVDTTGAGDAFAAGFLYGLLKGKELESCGRIGDIVARSSITQLGATNGLPTLNQLTEQYWHTYREEL